MTEAHYYNERIAHFRPGAGSWGLQGSVCVLSARGGDPAWWWEGWGEEVRSGLLPGACKHLRPPWGSDLPVLLARSRQGYFQYSIHQPQLAV